LGQPVYKRESFALAQAQIRADWTPMTAASRLRMTWPIPHRPLWRALLAVSPPWLASRLYRELEPWTPVPPGYPHWSAFMGDMQRLADRMAERISITG
jgi:hypothetical protein